MLKMRYRLYPYCWRLIVISIIDSCISVLWYTSKRLFKVEAFEHQFQVFNFSSFPKGYFIIFIYENEIVGRSIFVIGFIFLKHRLSLSNSSWPLKVWWNFFYKKHLNNFSHLKIKLHILANGLKGRISYVNVLTIVLSNDVYYKLSPVVSTSFIEMPNLTPPGRK